MEPLAVAVARRGVGCVVTLTVRLPCAGRVCGDHPAAVAGGAAGAPAGGGHGVERGSRERGRALQGEGDAGGYGMLGQLIVQSRRKHLQVG